MNKYLETAVTAARAAGDLIRAHFGQSLTVQAEEAHDIKLELDVRSQELISGLLLKEFPSHRIIGEEGAAAETHVSSDQLVWVIDPIDGTVNFFYNIPHFCISIALQQGGRTLVGVIFDPIKDELWTVADGQSPRLNDRPFQVSNRSAVSEAIISVGFSKTVRGIELGVRTFNTIIGKARKCRMMGSAALD
ncbi:MAG: inositol monophosphatase, partial [Verrucomicrobia bacterium]|nr:inositol monophosphatase [Verrucomicrobiota bacterium]